MQKPESILENETHKILKDSEIQTDPLILARRPDLVLINKKKERELIKCLLTFQQTTEQM